MNFTRRNRRLFLVLAVVGVGLPVVARVLGGSWPQAGLWLPFVWLGLAGAQSRRPWRRSVPRKELDEYRRWRAETELTEEEKAVQLPGELGVSLESATRLPVQATQPRPTLDERRRAFAASLDRRYVAKMAIGFSIATLVCGSVLPYAIVRGDYGAGIFGVVLMLVAPLLGYAAFSAWWQLIRGELFEPPSWLSRFGHTLARALNSNVGP
jgi:hypothetical protein